MKNEIMLNDENYVVCANDVVKGKQAMSKQTAKLIRIVITQIARYDKELKTYNCRITDLAKFLNISSDNLYRDIFKICEEAMKSVVYIGTGNPKQPWEMIHWISTAKYDGNGNLTVRLSDELKPFVLELEKWFTRYRLKNILEFNSFYAIRLYEIIICERNKSEENEFEFSLVELRQFFDCEKKYILNMDFIRKTVEVAVKEINETSDIYIETEYKKTGRAITDIKFTILEKYQNKVIPTIVNENINSLLNSHLKLLSEACNNEFSDNEIIYISGKLNAFVNEKTQISYLHGKYEDMIYRDNELKKKNDKIKNRFAYVKKLIENDYKEYLNEQAEKETNNTRTFQQRTSNDAAYDRSEYEKHSIADLSDEEWAKIVRGEIK